MQYFVKKKGKFVISYIVLKNFSFTASVLQIFLNYQSDWEAEKKQGKSCEILICVFAFVFEVWLCIARVEIGAVFSSKTVFILLYSLKFSVEEMGTKQLFMKSLYLFHNPFLLTKLERF